METTPPPTQGTKRKRDEPNIPRRIRGLDPIVVNKIAAGEIIVAPVNALKELIENAVDAGATNIEVLVRDGGLKLLQITDNGCGINKDDMAILCERFTTSKLKEFEDLQSIVTYGFRGEALASISHIAHLSVTTKTADSSCAWKAHYSDGKLSPAKPGQSADPKPCAGRQGTQIVVEDLFFNVPLRRRAFKNPSDEHVKILDLVSRYGVHCQNVAFSCKKFGEAGVGQSVPATATARERIRILHGSAVVQHLLDIELTDKNYGFKCEGLVSNANHVSKKLTLLLFINHRSVESSAVKRALDNMYSLYLPKGGRPFVYLSLEVDPALVDVNVHPTKREVNFLNEDEIIDLVCQEIKRKLATVDESRILTAQTVLSGGKAMAISRAPLIAEPEDDNDEEMEDAPRSRRSKPATLRVYENNLIRTDSQARKITSMFQKVPPGLQTSLSAGQEPVEEQYTHNSKEPTTCRLTTIKELRAQVRENSHPELAEIFTNLIFVGIVDEHKRLAAMQSGIKLLLVDYAMISDAFFYQLGLTDFGNFGTFRLDPPLPLKELLQLGARQVQAIDDARAEEGAANKEASSLDKNSVDWDSIVDKVYDLLLSRAEMLAEYFSMEISPDGTLLTLPLMLPKYSPPIIKLPNFLLRLGPHVDWTDEKKCFESFLHELALFYVPESIVIFDEMSEELKKEAAARIEVIRHTVEHVLFPAFKSRLVPTADLSQGVIEVANLKGLYRVFERC